MASALVVGCTGLVGSHILTTVLANPGFTKTYALSRREPPNPTSSSSFHPLTSSDSTKWPEEVTSLQPPPSIFLSALGSTRATAGSLAKQREIDYDLNLALAKAAKAAGVKSYVLISSAAVSTTSPFPYSKMKAELEEAVIELGFDHTVIVKPGLLVGERQDTRVAEAVLRNAAKFMGAVSGGVLKDFWAQDADVIARAAVSAGLKTLAGEGAKVWKVEQSEIVKLGRTEWVEPKAAA